MGSITLADFRLQSAQPLPYIAGGGDSQRLLAHLQLDKIFSSSIAKSRMHQAMDFHWRDMSDHRDRILSPAFRCTTEDDRSLRRPF
jgi:hypothetical protein